MFSLHFSKSAFICSLENDSRGRLQKSLLYHGRGATTFRYCSDSSSYAAPAVCLKRHYRTKMIILVGLLICAYCLPSFSSRSSALEEAVQPSCQTWLLRQELPSTTARMLGLPLYISGSTKIFLCLFQCKKKALRSISVTH